MTNDNVNGAHNESIYRKVIAMLHHFIYDLKKSIGLLLACIAIVVGVLYIYNYKQSHIYRSTFTVAYDELIRKVYGDRLNKLNTLISKAEHDKVADLLNIDKKVSATLKGIDGVNIIGERLIYDMNTDTIPFVVNVYMTDTVGLRSVQDGVVSFLETGNKYLGELKEFRLKQIADEITYLDKQLSLLDSAKSALVKNMSKDADSKALEDLYKLSDNLYKKRQDLLQKHALPATLHVIDEVIIPLPKGRSYILLGILGVLGGFVTYLLIKYLLIPAVRYKD